MSMLDAFFNKGFKGAKCKTLLKLTIPRIKLLRNRREIQLKQMRKDIAKLLENGQEATARIRVEHIIRKENMMAAQEILELLCELIAVRLPIIETQRECPLDLKEAISSICFAAPRCSDLPELQQIQMLFAAKYGREFVAAATELMPDSGVNRQLIELLSVRSPSVEAKLKLLKEIAEEHELDWDPAASETEYLKPHEDLLNGLNHTITESTFPLPKEKHEESISPEHREENEELDSDPGFDSLHLPEVPKVSVRTTAYSQDLDSEHIKSTSTSNEEPKEENPNPSIPMKETKQFQFIPFIASPPTVSSSSMQSDTTPFLSSHPEHSNPTESLSVDFQDVLEAVQAAAESAERAAAAARAAASLAEVRISELVTKRNEVRTTDGNAEVNPTFDEQYSFGHTDHVPHYEPNVFTDDVLKMMDGSLDMKEHNHQPRRSTSLENDPYYSYPDLFSRRDSRQPHEY